jgi:hypothetical protein
VIGPAPGSSTLTIVMEAKEASWPRAVSSASLLDDWGSRLMAAHSHPAVVVVYPFSMIVIPIGDLVCHRGDKRREILRNGAAVPGT